MLEQVAHYNDLSPKLRAEMETKIASFGKKVRYKFNISHPNPDPEKYNGPIVWPQMWTLDPITFRITDPDEDRAGKSKSKQIGMVNEVDDKGIPTSFHRVRVHKRHVGIVEFEVDNPHDQMHIMYLELHPKLSGGKFEDKKNSKPIFERIDELKEAKENRERRSSRRKALTAAMGMSEAKVKEFAAAMLWDEHQDTEILRGRIEDLSEEKPELFIDTVESSAIEYKAAVKRAMDKGVIAYNPAEYKFIYAANQQTIVSLGASVTAQNEVERMAEWLMTNGTKGDEVYKKIKGLSKV